MLETIRPKNQRPQLWRQGPIHRWSTNQKPLEELKEKGNKCVKEGEGKERLALLRVKRMPSRPMPSRLTPPRPMLARPEKPRKNLRRKPQRGNVRMVSTKGMLLKSCAITATRKAIIPSTALGQKISGSPDDHQRLYNAFSTFNARSSLGWWDLSLDINGLVLKTYGMVIAGVPLQNRRNKTKEVETWPESQSVRVSRIAASLILIFWTTDKPTGNKP